MLRKIKAHYFERLQYSSRDLGPQTSSLTLCLSPLALLDILFCLALDTSLLAELLTCGSCSFESSNATSVKCHRLQNIQSWFNEYFTVGIFLVDVFSSHSPSHWLLPVAHRWMSHQRDRSLSCLLLLLAQIPLWPKRSLYAWLCEFICY